MDKRMIYIIKIFVHGNDGFEYYKFTVFYGYRGSVSSSVSLLTPSFRDRTEIHPFSVRIRVGPYTTRSQTSPKHASSTSTTHFLLTLAVRSLPYVTDQELKLRIRLIFFLMSHIRS